jgi:hypothetical protein
MHADLASIAAWFVDAREGSAATATAYAPERWAIRRLKVNANVPHAIPITVIISMVMLAIVTTPSVQRTSIGPNAIIIGSTVKLLPERSL